MWSKRLITVIVSVAVCSSASLSVGPGTAAAITGKDIARVADLVAAFVSKKGNAAVPEVRQLFINQTKLTPVTDAAALKRLQTQWEGFTPRVAREEPRVEPFVVRKSKEVLCEAAFDFLAGETVTGWDYAWDQAEGQLTNLYPGGRQLALYTELGDIVAGFHNGCICQEVAALAVMYAKRRSC
jgi:hypothetical protein